MGQIKYYKGTQADFDKIIDKKNFAEVKKIYICEDGGIYFVIKDKKKKLTWWTFEKKQGKL